MKSKLPVPPMVAVVIFYTMIVVAIVAVLSLQGCAFGPASDAPSPECFASTVGPSGATDGSGITVKKSDGLHSLVVGTVWVHCDTSPREHILDVSLWAEPPGAIEQWHEVTDRGGITRIPNVLPYPNVVTNQCLPLEFQVRYSVTGVSSEGEPFTASGKGYSRVLTAQDCGLA